MIKFIYGNNDYGFFDKIDKSVIKKAKQIDIKYYDWITTNQFRNAKNHCASTTSSNLDIFFSKINYFSKEDLFREHHDRIGNGPVIGFANKTKKILNKKNIQIESKRFYLNKIENIKRIIDEGSPAVLLLSEALFNWHWVICIGYIETFENEIVLLIIDNWNKRLRYYIPGKGSILISVNEFKKLIENK